MTSDELKTEHNELIENQSFRKERGTLTWPPFLEKGCDDCFDYYAYIEGFGHIFYSSCTSINGGTWVRFDGITRHNCRAPEARDDHGNTPPKVTFERGLEVPVSRVICVADAPFGS